MTGLWIVALALAWWSGFAIRDGLSTDWIEPPRAEDRPKLRVMGIVFGAASSLFAILAVVL